MKISLSRALILFCLWPLFSSAQFTIEGVADKQVYANTVTLRIVAQAGFTYTATLNTNVVPAGEFIRLDAPDFYELRATRVETSTGIQSNRIIRFIVEDSERVGTEWGLPAHTPFAVVQSAASEFAGAHLRVLAPASFPTGYPVPAVVWAVDDADHAVRANGMVQNNGSPLLQLRRGVGSGFLPAVAPGAILSATLSIAGLTTNLNPIMESNVVWTPISGTLGSSTTWPEGSRIQVTSGLAVPAGGALIIGAGTIVRVNAGVSITNRGTITINGTTEDPVVIMPTVTGAPWGGFVQHSANTAFNATGTIFTGSGSEPCWFNGHGCSSSISGIGSHRGEQALISLNAANCNLSMTDCAAFDLAGQLGHSVSGGSYSIRLNRFLMQRCTTGGEYTSANFVVNDSAFIECPIESDEFEDGDNDALYIVSGTHYFTNTLFGWTKDDGIDSGGSGYAPLTYQSCWFEATFHEGNSLSGYKNTFARDTVYLNCGQGIEDGYDGPTGRVDHCLFAVCETGVRHGDNYPSIGNYAGYMTATNCLMLWNHRDILAFNWRADGWTNNYGQCFASNNWITTPDAYFPNNNIWDPAQDGWRLGAFGGVGRVGAGFAIHKGPVTLSSFPEGIPIGLSRFCTNPVSIAYQIDFTDRSRLSGTLFFPQGMMQQRISVPTNVNGVVRIHLMATASVEITGPSTLFFQNIVPPPGQGPDVISPLGAVWKYLDNGTDLGTAWQASAFNDSAWASGPGRLGFGPDPAPIATTLRRYLSGTSGPQFTNYYFRRSIVVTNPEAYSTLQFRYQRDDGCVVYMNGKELFRSNMPNPPTSITANTFASSTISGATASLTFWTNVLSATNLVTGTNVIAVEVHQISVNSSDICWDLELQGIPNTQPSGARMSVTRLGDAPVIYWTDPAYILEEADVVTGPWRTSDQTNSPVGFESGGNRFFRLRR